MIKAKLSGQVFASPKQGKPFRSSESSLCNDPKDLTVPTADVSLTREVNLPNKKSRRKTGLQKKLNMKEKSFENISKKQPNKYSSVHQDRASSLKVKAFMLI